ncbi:O-fucosyltransferase 36-like [Ipomoea triloba]|uniref:O-fucosyltransferase 36-like n=1 Tax=Ipomoea triloba TaxID=35885 RepID=UPI00125DC66A|nr:O-fucosyltransferase 36-like [Ipomoea triloba]
MDRASSSDDEEDRHNLIGDGARSPGRSSFQIDGNKNRFIDPARFNFICRKRYCLAIILPLFVIILYATTDIKNIFRTGVSKITFDSPVNRMRESELRALYLLRQQQLELFKQWNHTFVNKTSFAAVNNTGNSTSSNAVSGSSYSSLERAGSVFLEDLKADLLSQISLNKQIQQVLLSSHQLGNSLDLLDNNTDPSISGLGRCKKVDQGWSERKTIEWKPEANKYLFAICVSGQMSNHLICLEKHMFFAALLNRVLVIPSSKVDFEFQKVLDVDHINKCLGRKVVLTYEEFAESQKNHVHIDKVICYFSQPQPCFMDDDRIKKLKSSGVSMNKIETAWNEDVKKPKQRTVQDIVSKFSSNDDVIAIGDVFFADVERDWVAQPGGPIAHKCKTLIEPSRIIMLTAQRFVQTFLGEDFIALHFRRHGFLKFCNAKKPSCFYPVPQAADCINRVLERANSPVIYLSTDAAESETGLLQSLVVFNGKTVPLVKRPARNSAEKWDALLYRHGLEEDPQVEAMLDKTICALSSVFIGAPGSTFTEDILRLRRGWGSASMCDEYLCQGEVPNFIADDE